MKRITKLIILSLITASSLFAATPNIGDAVKQIQVPKEVKQKKTPLVEIGGVKKYAPIMKDDKSGKTIFVKSFKIEGAIHLKESTLQNLISSYMGKNLNFNQLQEVTSIVTKYYRSKKYFVARAYLPVQDINKNNGVITITIIEGNYGKFNLKNNSLVKDSIVQGMLDDAKRDNIVSTNTLERAMLIINDTPGVKVTSADVMPGADVGTSDFSITTEKTKRFDGYILADNYGSRYTGKNRIMAGVNINSPFKIGDKISLSGLLSNKTDLKNGRVAYSAPLMSNGLRGELSYSKTTYALGDKYSSLDAKGNSTALDATFTYPIIRTRLENLNASLNIAKKNLKDEINAQDDTTKKDVKSLSLGLDYDKSYLAFNLPSTSKVSFNYTYGKLSFDDASKESDDKAGANTNGNYSKINLDLSNSIDLTNKLSLNTSLNLQYALAHKNLDGSEDLSIGGAYGVKLYPDSEVSAENGYVFNIEAKYRLPDINALTNTVGIFYDRGRAFMANNNVGFEAKSLQDVGVGYYASYKDFFGQVQVAWNANSAPVTSEPNRNSRILFQGGWVF
ncbi:Polypeptide-transport-associated domain protein ShlB-type [Arcobacter nitrofigilis DSM 7299]|uniref:Polypeptide-transport-associated domain protein ShlB-type n=1 Tax=Arcobacter nitrofigilis (strain ATCC 33309 / DSM 7299 / CCUG 15893 / LMG 7604 / NCTC 12251 / CI) TaxID=572480 RepID=D5V7Z3_ARCNC|nr:ShlB/FhaC/HecB family hemolysin secretion/activation protein [Arcobacter nitrofigilis]ADG94763.1 Polypeptide-transport-associated domain protein ShlB-type [Arcobacter nitrofigilis DSM 7299]